MKRGLVLLLVAFCLTTARGASSDDCALSLPDYAYVQLSAYAGECRNGIAEGQGRVQVEMWQHGQRIWTGVLDGSFLKGLPSGPGTFASDDGSFRFEGTFRSGSMWEGKETRTRRDGAVFESEVRTGVPRQPKLASQSPAVPPGIARAPVSPSAAAESAAQSRAAGEMIGNKLADLLEGSIQHRQERRRADEQRRQDAARAAANLPTQQAAAPSQGAPIPQWEREQRAKQERSQKNQQEQYAKFQQQEKLRIAQVEIENKARSAKADQYLRDLDARNKAANEKERQRAADLKAQTDRADRERQAQQERSQQQQREQYVRFQEQEKKRIAQSAIDEKARQAKYEQAEREQAAEKKVLQQREQQRLADLKVWDERDKRERQEQQKKYEREQRERNAQAERAIKELEAKQKAAVDKHQRELEESSRRFAKQEKERIEKAARDQERQRLAQGEAQRKAQEQAHAEAQRLQQAKAQSQTQKVNQEQKAKELLSKDAQATNSLSGKRLDELATLPASEIAKLPAERQRRVTEYKKLVAEAEKAKKEADVAQAELERLEKRLDKTQSVLSAAGMVPGLGVIPDAANAGISVGRGDYAGAALNIGAAVPIAGDATAAARVANSGNKALLAGSDNVLKSVTDILMPGGKLIGKPGKNSGIRVLPGGSKAAEQLILKIGKGGRDITPSGHSGRVIQLPNNAGSVGFRPISNSGPPTVDVSIPGINIREIKFE